MFTSTIPVAQPVRAPTVHAHGNMRKVVRGLAIAAGTAAAGYGAMRIIRAKQAPAREVAKKFNDWLDMRLNELSRTLELGNEQVVLLREAVEVTAKLISKVFHKTHFLKAGMRDAIEMAMEQKFLKMRMKLHKKLDLKVEAHITALHSFYEDLRSRLFPSPVSRLDGEVSE